MPPVRTSSQASIDAEGIRKRVGKACDRCRMKKSKCDGSSPCSRCKSDNAICEFGERKRNQDKAHPKGYVEVLERLNGQLRTALDEAYKRQKAGLPCFGEGIKEANGAPLTHDVLVDLGILSSKRDSPFEDFEVDPQRLRQQLIEQGAEMTTGTRRTSISSGSEHSAQNDLVQTPLDFQPTAIAFDTKPNLRDFNFSATSSRLSSQSPAFDHGRMYPNAQPALIGTDPQTYEISPWSMAEQPAMFRSDSFASESSIPNLFCNTMSSTETYTQWNSNQTTDLGGMEMGMESYQAFPQQPSAHFDGPVLHHNPNPFGLPDYTQDPASHSGF